MVVLNIKNLLILNNFLKDILYFFEKLSEDYL